MATIKIFIDNIGLDEEKRTAITLKNKLLKLKLNIPYDVRTFEDLPPTTDEINDGDNEQNTIKAIETADIVIPIITSRFFDYITEDMESSYEEIIASEKRYFLPLYLSSADWSNYEWLVKSQLTPRNARPLNEHNINESELIINEFINEINNLIFQLYQAQEQKKTINIDQNENKKYIFISHSHDDADFAELLKLKLEKENISSWLDTEKLKIGQDWRQEIDQAIENCTALIAVMTPEARKSEYVTYEWAFAWGKNRKIFPLMLKQTQLHPRLESLQYLNFTNNPTRPWDDLIDSIKKLI